MNPEEMHASTQAGRRVVASITSNSTNSLVIMIIFIKQLQAHHQCSSSKQVVHRGFTILIEAETMHGMLFVANV